jgi:hypothetical protein
VLFVLRGPSCGIWLRAVLFVLRGLRFLYDGPSYRTVLLVQRTFLQNSAFSTADLPTEQCF